MNDNQRVFRVPKDRNFTIVKNHFIDDPRLSMKATAILLLVLRYPDNWRMSVKTMSKFKSDKDSSISSGFKELVTFGYAEFRKGKDPVTGRFNSGWYFFEESQKPEIPFEVKPTENKRIEKQSELFLKEVKESNRKENKVLDLEQPQLENRVVVNSTLPSTKEQKPSIQVFSSQIQNTTREYDQPSQARIEEQKELLEELEIKFKREKNQALGSPQAEKPLLDFPLLENPILENRPLSNTIYQGLSKQVLFKQILNTSREYGPPAKTHIEEQKQSSEKVNPHFHFPDSWLIKFQEYYFKEHGSEMGQPDSELKALNKLYELSNGDWNVIESKIEVLIQLRKQDSQFWYEQSLSPESITKFWSRLFERKVKPTEKNTKRNEHQNKSLRTESKYNESKSIPDKPIEIKDLDPYKCFLGWGKSKLLKSQLEYYEQNSDPFKYEGTKKILYEKFVNEVYPGLVSDSEVKKTSIENRKGSAA